MHTAWVGYIKLDCVEYRPGTFVVASMFQKAQLGLRMTNLKNIQTCVLNYAIICLFVFYFPIFSKKCIALCVAHNVVVPFYFLSLLLSEWGYMSYRNNTTHRLYQCSSTITLCSSLVICWCTQTTQQKKSLNSCCI